MKIEYKLYIGIKQCRYINALYIEAYNVLKFGLSTFSKFGDADSYNIVQ